MTRVRKSPARAVMAVALLPLSVAPIVAGLPMVETEYDQMRAARATHAMASEILDPRGIAALASFLSPSAPGMPGLGRVQTGPEVARWAAALPDRFRGVPVLLVNGVAHDPSGRPSRHPAAVQLLSLHYQLAAMRQAGMTGVSLTEFAGYMDRGRSVTAARPVLLTFAGSGAHSYQLADAVLRHHGFRATAFLDVSAISSGRRGMLTWHQVREMAASGRWDIEVGSAGGLRQVTVNERGELGPALANRIVPLRGAPEGRAGFAQRVQQSVDTELEALASNVPGYRPVAFGAPFGNVGQERSNDRRLWPIAQRVLAERFRLVFGVNGSRLAVPFARPEHRGEPIRRYEVSAGRSEEQARQWLLTQALAGRAGA